MSRIKVEGSIGQSSQLCADEDKADTARSRFAQLMQSTLHAECGRKSSCGGRLASTQRYRVAGGLLDGVECEVSEHGETISLKIKVYDYSLYRTLWTLADWLEQQLCQPGNEITLEVDYVECGT